jgi:hypothetical protein
MGMGDIGAPIYWRTDAPCVGRYHTEATSPSQLLALDNVNFALPNGGPNSLVHLAYFHANCLLTGPYKRVTEIHDNKIKKQTDIDRHGPKSSSNSSQPPDPPDFSLLTTFKYAIPSRQAFV